MKRAGARKSTISFIDTLNVFSGGFFICALAVFLLIGMATVSAEEESYAPGEILVKFKDLQQDNALESLRNRLQAIKIKKFAINGVYHLKLPAGTSVTDAVFNAYSDPNIEYAEPNYVLDINATPNDPNFNKLYGLHNTGQTGGTNDCDVDAPEAWNIITNVPANIVIAVIDTGVDYNHQDLAANMWVNADEIPDNGIDDDNNGYIDDYRGWDFAYNDNNPIDGHSHGTHCAGTIAAVGNNSIGISGVCWQAKIMPVKFLSDSGSGYTSDAIEAIQYATNNGAKILSNSWGGGGYSQALKDAIAASHDAGAIFVAAAGNSGSNNDIAPHYPSSYDVANVIAVAATDHSDNLAYFSCYGPTSVDLAAPGVNIYSTVPGNSYASYSGTSMATPHIAGICALISAHNSSLTNLQVKARLFSTVDALDSLSGKMITGGRANVYKAITAEVDTTPPAAINNLAVSGEATYKSVTLTWTATGDDNHTGTANNYDLRYATTLIDENNYSSATSVSGLPGPKASGSTETYNVSGLDPNTTYYFAIKALDEWGNTGSISNVISTTTGTATIIYQDKIEQGLNNWTISGTDGNGGSALWHQSHHRFHSSNTAWYYGKESTYNYNTGGRNYGSITSPTIDLSNATSADLVFNYWRSVESYSYPYDILNVEFSSDNGTTWETIWTISSTTASKKQWSSSEYIELTPGSSSKIRFSFDTRDGIANSFEGVYIDNIEIVGIEPPDDTAPQAISDLAASSTGTTYVKLSWTATGDDGTEGTAFSYDIRYATTSINNESWTEATKVSGEPTPEGSGNSQTHTITELESGTTYYFAMKAIDNAGNKSTLSNVISTTLLTPPVASVTPEEMPLVALEPNATTTKTLIITNEGSSNLEFSLTDTKVNSLSSPVLEAMPEQEKAVEITDTPQAAGKENELLVQFRPGTAINQINGNLGTTTIKEFPEIAVHLLKIDSAQSFDNVLAAYQQNPNVVFAEPNYLAEAFSMPNDPKFSQLYGLHNTGQTGGTADCDIDALETWEYFTGSNEMVIAVIDTGVDYKHPDLAANMWHNTGEIPGNGIDDDGNGYVDDYYGYDFRNNDGDPWDDHSHGTHCAGTIGAVGNNGIGVVGVNQNVKIMSLKFLSAYGSGSYADAVSAIIYASKNGAKISSNSWGGGGYSLALKLAIEYAKTKGCLFVAAAGNSAANSDVSPLYPAAYNCSNIISVAATDHKDNLAWFSNYGPTSVDLAAPGVYILSTLPNNSYGKYSGTSMATPHVGGACALVWGQQPQLTLYQIKQLILDSVDPISALNGKSVTGGRLNVYNAIKKEDDEIPPSAITDLATKETTFKSITLNWTATGDDNNSGQATQYDLRYATETITAENFSQATQVANEPQPKEAGSLESATIINLEYNTIYYFAVKVKDNVGNWSSLSNIATTATATPTIVFQDNMENGSGNWQAQTPWSLTEKTAHSTIMSWTDSPNDNYANYTDTSLVSQTVDLTNLKSASLILWHKYNLESNYDYAYVEISKDNGGSWTQIKSFTGQSLNWNKVSLNLNTYTGKTVKIRFRLKTDYSVVADGWYLDDVTILGSATASGWLTPNINSATVAPNESKTITFTYNSNDLDLGSYATNINISTNDPDHNLIIVPAALIVETTPPSNAPNIEINSVTEGMISNKTLIDVLGTIDYSYSVVSINGKAATVNNKAFAASINLAEGANTITVTARNSAGTTTKSVTLTLDTTSPIIAISSPAHGAKTNESKINIAGTTSDNIDISQVTVNNKSAIINSGNFTISNIALDEGENVITAQSTDVAGNIKTTSITVIKDTTAPIITITSPTDDSYLATKTISVSGTVSDANEVSSVTVNGLNASVESYNFNANSISLSEGENSIKVTAIDELGNRQHSSILVNLDTVAPAVTITSPAHGTVTKQSTIDVSGIANEILSSVTVNNRSATINNGNFSLNNLSLGEGQNTIHAQARDRAGNTGSMTHIIIYEVPQPKISVTPTSLPEVILNSGDTTSQTLTVQSTGEASLQFSINLTNTSSSISSIADDTPAPATTHSYSDFSENLPETATNTERMIKHAPDRLLVKFKDGISGIETEELNALVGAETVKIYSEIGVHKIVIHSGIDLREAISAYMENDMVDYAEPDYEVEAFRTPNDPYFSDLWGMHNAGQTGGANDADIDAPEAWDSITGSSNVIIAVVDTGIDYTHEDIAANMWHNTDEIAGNGIDDDGNGYVDDIYGYDFCNNDGDPYDDHSHGTHCSGTIAGVGNNGKGVAGVCWTAKLMGIKFLSGAGYGSTSDAAEGILYAANNGAQIMSNSWGGGGYSQTLKDVIDYAEEHGVLFVAAAGNSASNNDQTPSYPANYTSANVISVAAIDASDNLAYFSCYGATTVDIGAPGVAVLSSVPGNSYTSYSGTSMATPHVSGVAGLILAKNPNLTVSQLKSLILSSAVATTALAGKCVTGGRVNINNALDTEEDIIAPDPIVDLAVSSVTYKSIALNWTASGDDGNSGTASSYDVRYATATITAANFSSATKASSIPSPQGAGNKETFAVNDLEEDTLYYFAMKVTDNAGNQSTISNLSSAQTSKGIPVFSDNMESGTNGWTTSGGGNSDGTGLWHLSQHRARSGQTSWYYGREGSWNYNSGSANYGKALTPALDLTDIEDPTLSFYYWREVESYSGNYDTASVVVYTENGDTETIWYKSSSDTSLKYWLFSGHLDLSKYAGQKIWIGFNFATVDALSNGYEGWYIDDVRIYGAAATPDWISYSPNIDTLAPGEDATVTLYYNGDITPGEYIGTLQITNNDTTNNEVNIQLKLTVSALPELKWYLAEGCTNNMDQYILVMNPNGEDSYNKVTFMKENGETVEEYVTVGPYSRYTIHANELLDKTNFATVVESLNNVSTIVERTMYWDSGDLFWAGGNCTTGLSELSTRYYFAEGCTLPGFYEWLCLLNPSTEAAFVTVDFMQPDGATITETFTVGGTSRFTIPVNQYAPNTSISAIVSSNLPIAAERVQYWDSGEYQLIGGHITTGVTTPATELYLAEGSTDGFQEWIAILNHNSQAANITIQFMKSDGNIVEKFITVGPTSRFTVDVNSCVPVQNVSTYMSSDIPVVAERAMYWNSGNITNIGGHVSPATSTTSLRWNLAEGYTGKTFNTWIPIMNPNNTDSRIKVTFMQPDGSTLEDYFTIPATSRFTLHADDYFIDQSISTKIEVLNDVPVIVERAMYWDSENLASGNSYTNAGGHACLGVE